MTWHVYILRCNDDSLYCGITNNLRERLDEHNDRKGAKYTKTRLPVELVYSEELPDKSSACKREIEIRGGAGRKKKPWLPVLRVAWEDDFCSSLDRILQLLFRLGTPNSLTHGRLWPTYDPQSPSQVKYFPNR